jgi:hypothetical protein
MPYWMWIVLAVLGLILFLNAKRFGKLPQIDSKVLDLSMPVMGVMVLFGATKLFTGIAHLPGLLYSEPPHLAFSNFGIADLAFGLVLLGMAPGLSRCCRAVSIAGLYLGSLRFTAIKSGLLMAAWYLQAESTSSVTLYDSLSKIESSWPSMLTDSISMGLLSMLVILGAMIWLSVKGWPRVTKGQPDGDTLSPIVSYSALTAAFTSAWIGFHPTVIIILTVVILLLGSYPQPVANLIRKLHSQLEPKAEA